MKHLFISFLVLITTGTAFTQDLNLEFGPKAGLSISGFRTPRRFAEGDLSPRIRTHLGIFASGAVADQLRLQGELLFSLQGATEFSEFANSKIRISVNYVNVPVMLKYEVIDGLFVYIGSQLGVLVTSKGKVLQGQFEGTYDNKDDTKALDLSFLLGASYEIVARVVIEGRHNIGLIDLDKEAPIFRNRVFQISVGYVLGR